MKVSGVGGFDAYVARVKSNCQRRLAKGLFCRPSIYREHSVDRFAV